MSDIPNPGLLTALDEYPRTPGGSRIFVPATPFPFPQEELTFTYPAAGDEGAGADLSFSPAIARDTFDLGTPGNAQPPLTQLPAPRRLDDVLMQNAATADLNPDQNDEMAVSTPASLLRRCSLRPAEGGDR